MTDWADPSSAFPPIDADGVVLDPAPDLVDFAIDNGLNPAQQDILDLFDARAQGARQFDAGLRHELRAELEHGLAPLLDHVEPGTTLYFSKYPLAQIHGCEGRFLAERNQEFTWTAASARGSVSHK